MVLTTIKRWLGRAPEPVSCPDCGAQVPRLYCDVCGYDLVRGVKDSHQPPRPARGPHGTHPVANPDSIPTLSV